MTAGDGVGNVRPVLSANAASADALTRAQSPCGISAVPSVVDAESWSGDDDDMLLDRVS